MSRTTCIDQLWSSSGHSTQQTQTKIQPYNTTHGSAGASSPSVKYGLNNFGLNNPCIKLILNSTILDPDGRRLWPDTRQCRARLPLLSLHGQVMALLQLQGPILRRGQLCPSLHLVNTSPPSSDSSDWISHVNIFADQSIVNMKVSAYVKIFDFALAFDYAKIIDFVKT